MIIADKIIMLRKKNDWSQEQLAEQLGISRQSVSKWESAAAVPDLDRILKLSELFGVSVDYLVKDEMEEVDYSGTETVDAADGRIVSAEEADTYIKLIKDSASKIAAGVVLCILSPVASLLPSLAKADYLGKYETLAEGIGVAVLLSMISIAVFLFIMYGMKLNKYEYMEKEPISLAYGVKGIVEKKKDEYESEFRKRIAVGVVLCIFSVVPAALFSCFGDNPLMDIIGSIFLFVFVATGVYQFVSSGMIHGCYEKLLQEGEYTQSRKKENKKIGPFAGIYWCIITAIYLAISFTQNNWGQSWIVWPVAGVAFGAFIGMIRLIYGTKCKGQA
jgi:transcriptional regulator with XRE-family HTH domain